MASTVYDVDMTVLGRVQQPDLYVEEQGEGPALVLIPGGGGDAGVYADIAGLLAADFRVIRYDRRGNSRSGPVRLSDPVDPAAQAEDVLAILDSRGLSSALVFGSSGGAVIALELIATHPDRVSATIVHEPPAVGVLEPESPERSELTRIHRLGVEKGPMRAFAAFGAMTVADPPWPLRSSVGQSMVAAASEAALVVSRLIRRFTGKEPSTMSRILGNVDLLIMRELPDLCLRWSPEIEPLRAGTVPWVLGVGAASGGRPYDRPARTLAELTGAPWVRFPGGHTAYQDEPRAFVERLTGLLQEVCGWHEDI